MTKNDLHFIHISFHALLHISAINFYIVSSPENYLFFERKIRISYVDKSLKGTLVNRTSTTLNGGSL